MPAPPIEIEAKFVVSGLSPFRDRLQAASARQTVPCHRETNWRFDRADASVRAAGDVLRVRQGRENTLTLKAPGPDPEHRLEIEVEVDDSDRARLLLEALGYQVIFVYEKEREVYQLGQATVMLDELPFGSFVEIEAGDIELVRAAAATLGLDWADRVGLTYLGLFETLRARYDWPATDATFDALAAFDRPSIDDVMAGVRGA